MTLAVIPSEPGESRDPLKPQNEPGTSLSGEVRGSFDSAPGASLRMTEGL